LNTITSIKVSSSTTITFPTEKTQTSSSNSIPLDCRICRKREKSKSWKKSSKVRREKYNKKGFINKILHLITITNHSIRTPTDTKTSGSVEFKISNRGISRRRSSSNGQRYGMTITYSSRDSVGASQILRVQYVATLTCKKRLAIVKKRFCLPDIGAFIIADCEYRRL